MSKPSVFVGSSSEGLDFARAVRHGLAADAEVTLWNEEFFSLGSTFIETLVSSLSRFDFAVLLLTPDDEMESRDREGLAPRDNVIFELGLFMGHLGRSRTFMVHESGGVKIPTDLAGVMSAPLELAGNAGNPAAAVARACGLIGRVIRDLGVSESKAGQRLAAVSEEQERQRSQIEALSLLIAHFLPRYELEHLTQLASGEPFPFHMSDRFVEELRQLWRIGFIEKRKEFRFRAPPQEGDLRDFFHVTGQGHRYLQLRQRPWEERDEEE
jgi:hypothetical protein